MTSAQVSLILIADGGKKQDISYGSYKVYDAEGNLLFHKQLVHGFGTSNSAEYLTLLSALTFILAEWKDTEITLHIMMDSQLVVNQVNMNWVCNKEHLRTFRDRILNLIPCFQSFTIRYTPREFIVSHLGH